MNKRKNKNKTTSSYIFLIVSVSFMASYMYVSKDKYWHEDIAGKRHEVFNSPTKLNEVPIEVVIHEQEIVEEKTVEGTVRDQVFPEVITSEDNTLPSVSSFINNPEPMMKKIHQLTTIITRRHESRISDVLKNDNKEELFSKYIQLKNERGAKFFEQIKIDNSRATNQRINSEYQTKLLDVFGQETFTKYRSVLKQSNVEARAYNIILDF